MTDPDLLQAEPPVLGDEAAPAPIYSGPCRLLDWRQGARDGMTVDLRIQHPGLGGGHPFRGIECGREKGQRFRLLVREAPQPDASRQPIIHLGETVLMRWSENDRTGMMTRFMIDDGPDGFRGRHPFWGFAVGAGVGEVFDMAAWAISDDESAVAGSAVRAKTPFDQLSEVQQSQILAREPRFIEFLATHIKRYVRDDTQRDQILAMRENHAEFGAAAIRAALGVPSRAVMNRDGASATQARARWRMIMSHYEDDLFSIRGR